MAKLSDKRNDRVNNNNENPQIIDQQNIVYEHVINSEYTLAEKKFETATEDVLNTFNNMKTN